MSWGLVFCPTLYIVYFELRTAQGLGLGLLRSVWLVIGFRLVLAAAYRPLVLKNVIDFPCFERR